MPQGRGGQSARLLLRASQLDFAVACQEELPRGEVGELLSQDVRKFSPVYHVTRQTDFAARLIDPPRVEPCELEQIK